MPGQKSTEEQRRQEILSAAFTVASRERLQGVKVADVAQEAGVSKGLVYFYFDNKEALLIALLKWLLEQILLHRADEPEPTAPCQSPRAQFLAVLRRDIERLPEQKNSVELLIDYWVMGTRHPDIKRMIRGALDRYRESLHPYAARLIADEPQRYEQISASGLASVAAGFIEGCAIQTAMDMEGFDVEEYLRSLQALIISPHDAD